MVGLITNHILTINPHLKDHVKHCRYNDHACSKAKYVLMLIFHFKDSDKRFEYKNYFEYACTNRKSYNTDNS